MEAAYGQFSSSLPIPAAKLIEVNVPSSSPMTVAAVDLLKFGYIEGEFYA